MLYNLFDSLQVTTLFFDSYWYTINLKSRKKFQTVNRLIRLCFILHILQNFKINLAHYITNAAHVLVTCFYEGVELFDLISMMIFFFW